MWEAFEQAGGIAGIRKDVSVHTLRRWFATHLPGSGTELRSIQEILERKSSNPTEIYAHVCERDIGRIQSPLDSLATQQEGKADEERWRLKEGIREVVRLTCQNGRICEPWRARMHEFELDEIAR